MCWLRTKASVMVKLRAWLRGCFRPLSGKDLPLIPGALNDWTYETIAALCASGRSESDRHDFKFNVAELHNATKICCAFANTFGGFIVVGVKDARPGQFDIVGLDPDKELYGKLLAKVKADPEIGISPPKPISIPSSSKLLYVFEIPQKPSTATSSVASRPTRLLEASRL
jgi:hypothetical protein